MNFLKVILWGREIGRLVWEPRRRCSYFMFNSDVRESIPDIIPLLSSKAKTKGMFPVYGDDRQIYQGLPPFIADSLPDSWGHILFDKWVRDSGIPKKNVTPLYKLMFIGKRGMGAFEYEPAEESMNHEQKIDIQALYKLSLEVLEQKENARISPDHDLTMQALLSVGTSAGGRQMKAIIAINEQTGEIRSGQTSGLADYEHYILKFGEPSMATAEIEMTYYAMARDAGIEMEECRLMNVEGVNHFLTKRFDREGDKKVLMQTLAAIYPDARSYEDLIYVCRELSIKEKEINQLYRRIVFNVMANNTDDHYKNFSFIMREDGVWHLSPAYDITFIFNKYGSGPSLDHVLSVMGQISDIDKSDLLEFARRYDIKGAGKIIDEVAAALGNFDKYSQRYGITKPWVDIIRKTIQDNLRMYGYAVTLQEDDAPIEIDGHLVDSFAISLNSKGFYDVNSMIDGNRRRRVIRPNQKEFNQLQEYDIFNLNSKQKAEMLKLVFKIE